MERYESLKSAGFSEKFIEELKKFEELTAHQNVIHYTPETPQILETNEVTGDFILTSNNSTYRSNLIIDSKI